MISLPTTLQPHYFDKSTLFFFPGQGEQSVGMGRDLVDAFPATQEVFNTADDLLGFSLSQLCFDGPEETLNDTVNAQPAVLTVSVAALVALNSTLVNRGEGEKSWQEKHWVAGHSLGEYTALVAAGSLDFADALRLVRRRGEVMKAAGEKKSGMMAAVLGLDDEEVASICQEVSERVGSVQIANDNCPGQLVISGEKAAVEAAMSECSSAKARKVVPLAVSVASHSPLMAPAQEALAAAVERTRFRPPQFPLIANTTALPISTVAEIKAELVRQLTGSVRWTETVRFALNKQVAQFVEIGPGKTLNSLVKRIDRKSSRISVNSPESIFAFASN